MFRLPSQGGSSCRDVAPGRDVAQEDVTQGRRTSDRVEDRDYA